ncbi:hypothetical protein ENHY17A_170009 [Moraxellaceae bacterium 17A]|nr:hypothetical protein ENHY17A_170009 [Moraxellaceae bacterium 17A]
MGGHRFESCQARILLVCKTYLMADVAQLVEPRVVISVVVGSSPIIRPIF